MPESGFEKARGGMLKSAREGIKSSYSSEEHALIQAINAYNETSKSYNLAFKRLSEWYGLYFPELEIGNPKVLVELALVLSDSQSASKEQVLSALKDEKFAAKVYARVEASMGRRMGERDAVASLAMLSKSMGDALDGLGAYIKKVSTELMPNTTYLTDEKIAAELLSKAGSMERLAVLPASTVQLLGAERSLFKHLKFGSKPPKYGILFKLPEVSGAQRDQRGRIARLYATKICMALKGDYFTKHFIAEKLKADIKKGIEAIKHSKPRERKYERYEPRAQEGRREPYRRYERPFSPQGRPWERAESGRYARPERREERAPARYERRFPQRRPWEREGERREFVPREQLGGRGERRFRPYGEGRFAREGASSNYRQRAPFPYRRPGEKERPRYARASPESRREAPEARRAPCGQGFAPRRKPLEREGERGEFVQRKPFERAQGKPHGRPFSPRGGDRFGRKRPRGKRKE